ncbi:hypothetical protein EG68_05954 [Paragonimus skrjabini miyazakii]|uniref:DUF4218 domain-containing protein n=1 Tax=Paragonimus skrjabini miyazakii TaxID=59628 RepID=A0A8S9YUY0_9TREM|nr:hypothetical protein EG68_05954 [Paragonimus skrjabini miyazakii]
MHITCFSYVPLWILRCLQQYRNYYGPKNVVFNVHSLIHLCSDVSRYGTIDHFSAFVLESNLGKLCRKVRGPRNTAVQLSKRLTETAMHSDKRPQVTADIGCVLSANLSEAYGEARAHVSEAITESDGVTSDATVPMTYRPKRLIKKPRRLTESTTEVSTTDTSTSNDTPPEGNRAALAEYHIIDVDLPPNPQSIHTSSSVISPQIDSTHGFTFTFSVD